MPVLLPSEYDAAYFEGDDPVYTAVKHQAGYSFYSRRNYPTVSLEVLGQAGLTEQDSSGWRFGDWGKLFTGRYNMNNADVLIIGCAYGFLLKALRDEGVNAFGVDVSQFAYDRADPAIQPFITVADIRTHIWTYKRNEWDFIISRNFLCCMSDLDLTGPSGNDGLVEGMNRACRGDQIHMVNPNAPPEYYNPRTAQEWSDSFDWDVQTRFIPLNHWRIEDVVTKIN